MNGVHITRPFDQDPRRLQSVKDHVAAIKEEDDLTGLVAVFGSERAQSMAQGHRVNELVAEINGHA